MRHHRWTNTLLATTCLSALTTAVTAGGTHDPNRTATIYVHGFDSDGADTTGVFGEDGTEPLLAVIADMAGLGLLANSTAPNVIATTTYYGDTPPSYYTSADIAQLNAITAQWGGGMPRYAFIVAKYARHVMDRTGAEQVNIVSASMGTYVARWLIEKNTAGLAGEGHIARWLSLEGVLGGHWAASNDAIGDLWDEFGTPSIDVNQMHYAWCEAQYGYRLTMDNPLFADILVGWECSTRDTDGDMTDIMLYLDEYQANDGVVAVADAWFHSIDPQSMFLGHAPTHTYFHVNHYELQELDAGMAQVANFIVGSRRVRVHLISATINDLQEPDDFWWDFTPAEIVFTSAVVSPMAETRWGITAPMCNRPADSYASPIHEVDAEGDTIAPDHLVYDDFLAPGETTLTVTVGGIEVDQDLFYDVFEPLIGDGWDQLGDDTISIDVSAAGIHTRTINTASFNGLLRIEVIDYPFASLDTSIPGDVNGDGVVGVEDLLEIIAAWGPCSSCPADLNGDGVVDVQDVLQVLALWTV